MDSLPVYTKHAFLILIGVILLLVAGSLDPINTVSDGDKSGIFYDILVNVGSDLIAVTSVFLVFEFFRSKPHSIDNEPLVPPEPRGSLSKYTIPSISGSPERDYEEKDERHI